MEVIIQPTYREMSRAAALQVRDVLNRKPNAVLGMATGSTPLGMYQALVRMHKEEGLDFSQVTQWLQQAGLVSGDATSLPAAKSSPRLGPPAASAPPQ